MTIPSFRLDGKVALITGGSKGLGRAMALGFAEAGADVVVSSRKIEACEVVAAEHLPAAGSIINISSQASMRPTPHTVVYSAAKAGLNALTQAASQELGPRGIRVNAIVCGPFHTDSFDRSVSNVEIEAVVVSRMSLGRIAAANEVVGTALFLASDASAYMTGALLALDGGVW